MQYENSTADHTAQGRSSSSKTGETGATGDTGATDNTSETSNTGATGNTGAAQSSQESNNEWPVMETAAFYGFAGEVVNTITPHSESDPVALLLQLLVCFGNIIGRKNYFQVESTRHHANLFVTLVGTTSKTRKGTSFGRVIAVARGADCAWADERVIGGLSSGEGLINSVRDPTDDAAEVEDKRLLVIEPEFSSVLSVMERSGNNLSQIIRKAWDGDRLATLTKIPLTATGAHISLIGHITEDELRARLTRTDMANGFANRFLFALVRRSKELPFGGNLADEEIDRLGNKLRAIVAAACSINKRVTMTDAARAEWVKVYGVLSGEKPGLLGAVTARAEAQVVRLALIYALLDKASQIGLEHLQAAIAVWKYCEISAKRIFGDALGDNIADAILRALKGAGAAGLTRNEIFDLFGRHQPRGRIEAALSLLLQYGRAKPATRRTAGRSAEVWVAL